MAERKPKKPPKKVTTKQDAVEVESSETTDPEVTEAAAKDETEVDVIEAAADSLDEAEPLENEKRSEADFDRPEPVSQAPEPLLHHDELPEEHHASLSSKVLTGLAIMAAGGFVALWGGPKVAPHLPSGLAPVANFLTPGKNDTVERLEAVEADFTQRLAELENNAAEPVSTSEIDDAISKYDGVVQERLTGLSEQISAVSDQLSAADSQDIESRLRAAETNLQGVSTELTTLTDQLTNQLSANTEGLSAESAAQLAGILASVEGLKAQIGTVSTEQGALSQRIDEVAAISAREVAEAENLVSQTQETATAQVTSAKMQRHLTAISSALASGKGFQTELDEISKSSDVTVPEALAEIAEGGTATLAQLRAEYPSAAHEALRASIKANAGESVTGKLGAFFKSQIGTRSLEPKTGDDTDAVLSRIEALLSEGDLQALLAEAETLQPEAGNAMAPWLSKAAVLGNGELALEKFAESLKTAN